MYSILKNIQGTDITENDSFRQAGKRAKMDDAEIEKCIKFIDDSKVKKILIETTEEALEYGVSHFLKLNELKFIKSIDFDLFMCSN